MSAFTVRDIDDLYPLVQTHAPQAPEPVIRRFLIEAARTLCKRGRMWKVSDSWTVSTPTLEPIETIPDARIHAIEMAELNGADLEAQTPEWLDNNVRGWRDFENTSTPKYITQIARNTIQIVPPVPGVLKARFVLIPSRTATTLPEFLVEDYGEELAAGAVGEILIMPDVAYANPALAQIKVAKFDTNLRTVFTESTKGQQRTKPRTRGRFF